MIRGRINKSELNRSDLKTLSIWRRLLGPIVALVIVAGGVAGGYLLIWMKKPPQRKEINNPPPLVEVVTLEMRDIRMIVRGHGTVSPKVRVDIIPEVPGKVVYGQDPGCRIVYGDEKTA